MSFSQRNFFFCSTIHIRISLIVSWLIIFLVIKISIFRILEEQISENRFHLLLFPNEILYIINGLMNLMELKKFFVQILIRKYCDFLKEISFFVQRFIFKSLSSNNFLVDNFDFLGY